MESLRKGREVAQVVGNNHRSLLFIDGTRAPMILVNDLRWNVPGEKPVTSQRDLQCQNFVQGSFWLVSVSFGDVGDQKHIRW